MSNCNEWGVSNIDSHLYLRMGCLCAYLGRAHLQHIPYLRNAFLAAAAPQLLEVARELLRSRRITDSLLQHAEEAIQKAEEGCTFFKEN